jgi:hypothetical protein
MQDLLLDWNKWTRSERVFAVVITSTLVALPLGLLLGIKIGL